MADFASDEPMSWSTFVDAVAGPLRLEPKWRQDVGLAATLHLVAALWGDVAFWRAAERFVRTHHYSLVPLPEEPLSMHQRDWYRHFLAGISDLHRIRQAETSVPLPAPLLKPAVPPGAN